MPAPVSFTITLAPLPLNFDGTPQKFAEALVDRLTIAPSTPWSAFITGSVIPTSDNGPLLYNGGAGNKEWRVWDTGTGAYTYLAVNGAGIISGTISVSKLATDLSNAKSVFTLNATGVPTLKTGSTGDYLVMGSSGPEFKTIPALTFAPARATSAAPVTFAVDGTLHKLTATSELFDPQNVYDATNSRYVAPTTGIYFVSAHCQADNSGADATTMEIAIGTSVNGNPVLSTRQGGGYSVASPPGSRWYPIVSGLIALTAGDQLEIYMSATTTGLAGNLTLSSIDFSVHRIQ